MSLFDGVENFTPAFTGQQIANQTGAGAAQALTSGMNAGSRSRSSKSGMMGKQMAALDTWANDVSNYMGGGGDWMSETGFRSRFR